MKRITLHIAAFFTIVMAILSTSCEGPGVIEQNVYLEDTLIKTVYDTVYYEKEIEVPVYERIQIMPDSILFVLADGGITGGEIWDTIRVVYPDTIINQPQLRFSENTNTDIDSVWIDDSSIRTQIQGSQIIITTDLIIRLGNGDEVRISDQVFLLTYQNSESQTALYQMDFVEATVIWRENGLALRNDTLVSEDYLFKDELIRSVYSADSLRLELSMTSSQNLVSYGIRGDFSLDLSSIFPDSYTIKGKSQQWQSDYINSPFLIDKFEFDTNSQMLLMEDLSSYENEPFYLINRQQDRISPKQWNNGTVTNSIYMNIPSSDYDKMPDSFVMVFVIKATASNVINYGPTNEKLDLMLEIRFRR